MQAAAAVINAAGISASPSSAKPGEQVQVSVAVTNSGAATPGDDFPVGGSATATVTLTQITTGYSFVVSTTVRTTAIIAGAGGAGSLSGNVTVPMIRRPPVQPSVRPPSPFRPQS
jgi:hypothetical protein